MNSDFLRQRWRVRTGRFFPRFYLLRLIPLRTYSRAVRTGDELAPAVALDAAIRALQILLREPQTPSASRLIYSTLEALGEQAEPLA